MALICPTAAVIWVVYTGKCEELQSHCVFMHEATVPYPLGQAFTDAYIWGPTLDADMDTDVDTDLDTDISSDTNWSGL